MVFFTCNACGQCVKKIHVEKHYLRECRSCEVLSCMDCGKDFFGDEYKQHTKCITENEKYGGKDYVASSKANKGEVKQSQWIECVQAASSSQSLNPRARSLLERLANYDNIPRKKVKFERFLQNGLNVHDAKLIEQIWTVFSEAGAKQKNTLAAKTDEGTKQENGTSSGEHSGQGNTKADLKKKKDKSRKEMAVDDGGEIGQDDGESTKSDKKKKKKKKKKREEEEVLEDESDEETPCSDDAAMKTSKKRKHKKRHDQPEQLTLNGEEEEDRNTADEEIGEEKKNKKHKRKKQDDDSAHNGLNETADATEETENGESEPSKKRKRKKHRRNDDQESQTLECDEKDNETMKSVETEGNSGETVSKKSKKRKHKNNNADGELLKSELKRIIHDDGALDVGSSKKKSQNKMDRVHEEAADHKKKKRKAADDSNGRLDNLKGDDESGERNSEDEKKKKKGAKDKKKGSVNLDESSVVDDNSGGMNTDGLILCKSEIKKKKRKQKDISLEA